MNRLKLLVPILLASFYTVQAGDLNRQAIIFNEGSPDLFYCPQVEFSVVINLLKQLQRRIKALLNQVQIHLVGGRGRV